MSSFSDFSTATYGQPGVEAACLRLQDRHGVDVNLLLFGLWNARDGNNMDPPSVRAAIAATADWQSGVVRPLRALRRRLKEDHHVAPTASAERVREQVKAAELEAEWAEQEILSQRVVVKPDGNGADGLARRNICTYLDELGAELDADDLTAVDLLAGLVDSRPPAANKSGGSRT